MEVFLFIQLFTTLYQLPILRFTDEVWQGDY